jgi:hypothetical protein
MNFIPLPNVYAQTLAMVIEYCKKHVDVIVRKIGRFRVKSADSTRNRTGPIRFLPDSQACAIFSKKIGWTVSESADFPIFRPIYTDLHRFKRFKAKKISIWLTSVPIQRKSRHLSLIQGGGAWFRENRAI